jgi:putative membrane protein
MLLVRGVAPGADVGAGDDRAVSRPTRLAAVLLAITLAALAWSAYRPHDLLTWVLEVSPAVVALLILAATYRRFPLTPLSYVLITAHALVLIVGGHYTYARVPLGEWLQELMGTQRNHYDRFAHFVQGFVPAMAAREVLLRCSPLRPGAWLFFLVTCVCGTISAVYEILEWLVSVVEGGSASVKFLGTQGDVFDPQKDMGLCLLGAMVAQLALARAQDRQLEALGVRGEGPGRGR